MNHAKDLRWMIGLITILRSFRGFIVILRSDYVSYEQALLLDKKALETAQQETDVVNAQEILQNAFRTDVRALVAEVGLRFEAALNTVALYRIVPVRKNLIGKRGLKTMATGL